MKAIRQRLLLIAKGFCMGTADVVPGVSGGTMALILGIYPRLIEAIKSFDRAWLTALISLDVIMASQRPHLGFLIPLSLGIMLALLCFTRIIPLPALIINHPEAIYSLFFGLIAGSVVILYRAIRPVHWRQYLSLAAALLLGLILFNLIPADTPEAGWFIFLSGALAVCAMLLPGVSGSFVLLLLNKYSYIFNAIAYLRLSVLIPFALGAIAGLLLASRALSYLLRRHYNNTLFFIIGLLLASLSVIWPYQHRRYIFIDDRPKLIDTTIAFPPVINAEVMMHAVIALAGFAAVLLLHRLQPR